MFAGLIFQASQIANQIMWKTMNHILPA
jgi:hypothetical protein